MVAPRFDPKVARVRTKMGKAAKDASPTAAKGPGDDSRSLVARWDPRRAAAWFAAQVVMPRANPCARALCVRGPRRRSMPPGTVRFRDREKHKRPHPRCRGAGRAAPAKGLVAIACPREPATPVVA